MKKFLITGGAGFIGSNIAQYLIENGHFVRVLDNFHTGKEENLKFAKDINSARFELMRGDVTNKEDCSKACAGMDFALHQAALLSVIGSMKDPLSYNRVNINGTLLMLQAAAEQKVKRLVFASSAAVYGDAKQFPLTEENLPLPISPYALSKLAGEYYCRIFAQHFGIETVCLRYFNVFGPGQAADDEYSSVIPKFIGHLLNNEPTPIFGNGEQSRDFVYIKNIVQANVLAATTPGLKHEIVNVANGDTITILELSKLLGKILSKNIEPQFFPCRSGDIFKIDADVSKLTKMLNYKPLMTFEEGLTQTVRYYQEKRSDNVSEKDAGLLFDRSVKLVSP